MVETSLHLCSNLQKGDELVDTGVHSTNGRFEYRRRLLVLWMKVSRVFSLSVVHISRSKFVVEKGRDRGFLFIYLFSTK